LIHPEDDKDGMDLESDDEYMKSICDMLNLEENGGNGFDFDINFIIEEEARPTNQYAVSRPSVTHSTKMGVLLPRHAILQIIWNRWHSLHPH
jgi:hypothetical protein